MTSQPERMIDLFDGPSEMHALMRAFDWSSSAAGPPEHWPQSLRVVVRTLLASHYPMVMTWGPDFTLLYNDAYAGLIGDKHPSRWAWTSASPWPRAGIRSGRSSPR